MITKNTANKALTDAHKDYIKVLKERIDDRNETITNLHKNMWADANEIGELKAIIKYLEQKIDFLSVSTKGE